MIGVESAIDCRDHRDIDWPFERWDRRSETDCLVDVPAVHVGASLDHGPRGRSSIYFLACRCRYPAAGLPYGSLYAVVGQRVIPRLQTFKCAVAVGGSILLDRDRNSYAVGFHVVLLGQVPMHQPMQHKQQYTIDRLCIQVNYDMVT